MSNGGTHDLVGHYDNEDMAMVVMQMPLSLSRDEEGEPSVSPSTSIAVANASVRQLPRVNCWSARGCVAAGITLHSRGSCCRGAFAMYSTPRWRLVVPTMLQLFATATVSAQAQLVTMQELPVEMDLDSDALTLQIVQNPTDDCTVEPLDEGVAQELFDQG